MTYEVLLYIGSVIIIVWGIAHIVPTRSVVSGFGNISVDNKRIITMEWIMEGVTLCFIGLLVLSVTVFGRSIEPLATAIYWASAAMLLVMAVLSLFTGARTSIIPMKFCPAVKTIVAILFILGS
jgi:chromate transport protein ChrA